MGDVSESLLSIFTIQSPEIAKSPFSSSMLTPAAPSVFGLSDAGVTPTCYVDAVLR